MSTNQFGALLECDCGHNQDSMQTEVSSQCSSSSTHSPVGGQLAADSAGPAGTVGRPAGVLIEAFESSANKECPIRETADCNTNSSIIGSVVPRRSRWGPKSTQLTADRSAPLRTRRCTRGGGHPEASFFLKSSSRATSCFAHAAYSTVTAFANSS